MSCFSQTKDVRGGALLDRTYGDAAEFSALCQIDRSLVSGP
jgi:hypothetical protein